MTTTILCEKYSQAKAIAEAMSFRGMSGSWQGQRLSITWASGHLLEYEPPDSATPQANWHDPESLIPLPDCPSMQPTNDSGKRLTSIKSALASADTVWLATDPDREGEAIGRELLEHLRYRGPVKRLWLAGGMDTPSIRKALDKLRPGDSSLSMWRAQQARARSDYGYMYVTRAATACARAGGLGENLGTGSARASVASVGRVQTPTLRLIVERDSAIAEFRPVTHYRLRIAVTQRAVEATLAYDPDVTESMTEVAWPGVEWRPREKGVDTPLFVDLERAERLRQAVATQAKAALRVQTRKKTKPAPKCLALIDLQRAASRMLKLSSAKTLSIAQTLYTNGHISYPRTEHPELPMSAWADAPAVLDALTAYPMKPASHAAGHVRRDGAKPPNAYRDKAMEHHGLMPTESVPDASELSAHERAVYELIARRYIQAHWPDARVERIKVSTGIDTAGLFDETPAVFSATGERVLEAGWMAAFPPARKAPESPVTRLTDGESDVSDTWLDEDQTEPPERFTEDTLLAAMKNAARFVPDDMARTLRQANGLGTPATRGAIIETLVTREYIDRDKAGRLTANSKGRDLIERLPDELSDIALTAAWEAALSGIENAHDNAAGQRDAFISEQYAHITTLIRTISRQMPAPDKRRRSNGAGGDGPPTKKMLELARKVAREKGQRLTKKQTQSFAGCRAWLDDNLGNSGSAPTQKMIGYAQYLARQYQVTVPAEANTSYRDCKAFIQRYAPK